MVIITQLTQVRKEKNGKINSCPGIEPGTQRLGVQYTKHPRQKNYLPILSYVLPVVVGESANLTLADPPNLPRWEDLVYLGVEQSYEPISQIGAPLYNGQKACSQCVRCSEAPL